MLKHVIMMKFKPVVKQDEIIDFEESLAALPGRIAEIKGFEFGRDIIHSERSYDFALISTFDNIEALKRYQAHPVHLPVIDKVKNLCERTLAVDFEAE